MVQQPQDQDKGLAHCHYIRKLANEIWLKENARPGGNRMKFDDAIRQALMLHRKKLINNQVDRVMGATPRPPGTIRRPIEPNRRLGW